MENVYEYVLSSLATYSPFDFILFKTLTSAVVALGRFPADRWRSAPDTFLLQDPAAFLFILRKSMNCGNYDLKHKYCLQDICCRFFFFLFCEKCWVKRALTCNLSLTSVCCSEGNCVLFMGVLVVSTDLWHSSVYFMLKRKSKTILSLLCFNHELFWHKLPVKYIEVCEIRPDSPARCCHTGCPFRVFPVWLCEVCRVKMFSSGAERGLYLF